MDTVDTVGTSCDQGYLLVGLAVGRAGGTTRRGRAKFFACMKPATGFRGRKMPRNTIMNVNYEVELDDEHEEVERLWTEQFEHAAERCSHTRPGSGNVCATGGAKCKIGSRHSSLYMITGATLPVWGSIEDVVARGEMEIVRLNTTEGERLVGLRLKSERELKRVKAAVETTKKKGDAGAYQLGILKRNDLYSESTC